MSEGNQTCKPTGFSRGYLTRPRNDMFIASDTALTLGASPNMSPANNRCVVCFSSPQDHCVTRGFMEECAPTINAAAGMSGNNRPFIVKSYGFDSVASGDTSMNEEVSKCITTAHGRNGAGALSIKKKSHHHEAPIVLNYQGSKGNNVVSQDETCPTINSMHGHDVHVVCVPINSMVIGKDGGNGDRQTFGIGEDGDPSPTLQTGHHHAVAITKRKKAFGIDQQGGKGGANFTEDVAPTICSDSHGTPHGVCLVGETCE